jgi:hypothetical protein
MVRRVEACCTCVDNAAIIDSGRESRIFGRSEDVGFGFGVGGSR